MSTPADSTPSASLAADQLAAADAAAKSSATAGTSVASTQPCPFAGLQIEGSAEFREKTLNALKEIEGTASGKALLGDLEKSGKTVKIVQTDKGNSCGRENSEANVGSDGKPGKGCGSTVNFNPDKKTTGGAGPWKNRPPAIGLAHELIHAAHNAQGTRNPAPIDNDNRPDPANPGKKAQIKAEEIRTVGIPPYDQEPYTENSIRREWKTPQAERTWY